MVECAEKKQPSFLLPSMGGNRDQVELLPLDEELDHTADNPLSRPWWNVQRRSSLLFCCHLWVETGIKWSFFHWMRS
ncbi:hypothetical protein HHUSO_G10565 [Huso huso]|uniref:Uncharacterized protein n=1 Tax=Huso huso TaxID=61971 RepID=A0ABR0ZPY6_HUSHU